MLIGQTYNLNNKSKDLPDAISIDNDTVLHVINV